jgi:hypothetical protein
VAIEEGAIGIERNMIDLSPMPTFFHLYTTILLLYEDEDTFVN